MSVTHLQYVPFEGKLTNQHRWLAIFLFGLECTFRRRLTIILLILAWLNAIVQNILFLLITQGQQVLLSETQATRYFTSKIITMIDGQTLCLVVLLAAVGSGLISNDLKNSAYQLYFARPIKIKDYLLGKFLVIACYSFIMMWLPLLFFWGYCWLLSGQHSSPNWALIDPDITLARFGQTLLYLFLITIFMGSTLLALSSLTKNSKFVGIVFLAVFFLGKFVETLASFLPTINLSFLSYLYNLSVMGRWIMDFLEGTEGIIAAIPRMQAIGSWITLAVLLVLCLIVLRVRLLRIIRLGQ